MFQSLILAKMDTKKFFLSSLPIKGPILLGITGSFDIPLVRERKAEAMRRDEREKRKVPKKKSANIHISGRIEMRLECGLQSNRIIQPLSSNANVMSN